MTRLAKWISACTLVWLLVYAPVEIYYTVTIAGVGGLLYSSFILNVVGMCLMLWGALAVRRQRPTGPAVLAVGWAWTAATFWRATSDRFWWVSLGHPLLGGPSELWLAPILTALALCGLALSMLLVFREARDQS